MTHANGRRQRAQRRLSNARHPDVSVLPVPDDVLTEWDVAVPVRDGTVLRVNVFRPRAAVPVPVILSAHPYGKDHMPATSGKAGSNRINAQYHAFPQPHPIRFSAWTGWEAPDPAVWVARGYAVVNADLRGAGTSEGGCELLAAQEHRDVHDLL